MSLRSNHELTEAIKRLARKKGASLVGCADMDGLVELPRAVVIMVAHSSEVLIDPTDMPNLPYLREIPVLNERLTEIAGRITTSLREQGFEARGDPPTGYKIDDEKLAAPFSHKTAATRAGLGWIGKCALIVTPELGPALRLTSVFTDAPLEVGEPVDESCCGNCTMCEDICPAGAVSGDHWYAGRPREEFYDARACREVCFGTSETFGDGYRGCGACMAVCPVRPR